MAMQRGEKGSKNMQEQEEFRNRAQSELQYLARIRGWTGLTGTVFGVFALMVGGGFFWGGIWSRDYHALAG